MAQSVVVKKAEKAKKLFQKLGLNCTLEEFANGFKDDYPEDWERINKRYIQHERRDTKDKGHPMPKPNQYIKNMYSVGKSKFKKE